MLIAQLEIEYGGTFDFEVVSEGLMLGNRAGQIEIVALYIKRAYMDVEETTGVKFGDKFIHGTFKQRTMILNSFR